MFESNAPVAEAGSMLNQHDSIAQLDKLITCLAKLLDYEQQQLKAHKYTQLEALAADKHRLMNNIARLSPHLDEAKLLILSPKLKSLKDGLARNIRLLQMRSGAIGELAQSIEQATRDAKSDGTYHPHLAGNF